MKRHIIILSIIGALIGAAFAIFYFYRPNWEVQKIVREGELTGQTVQTVTAVRSFRDFTFSPTMNGMTAYIADLPANANILSLHVRLKEMFTGADEAMPGMQAMIQNDDGTACMFDIGNIPDEIQLLTSHKLCSTGQKGMVFLRDASAMPALMSGNIEMFLSYIVF